SAMASAISISRWQCAGPFRGPSFVFCQRPAMTFSTTSRSCSSLPRWAFLAVLLIELSDWWECASGSAPTLPPFGEVWRGLGPSKPPYRLRLNDFNYDLSDNDDPGWHLAAAAGRYISPGLLPTRRCNLARTGAARALAAAPASRKLRRKSGVSQALRVAGDGGWE